jgi:hypothetical protein
MAEPMRVGEILREMGWEKMLDEPIEYSLICSCGRNLPCRHCPRGERDE